jgi:hypothetical protein
VFSIIPAEKRCRWHQGETDVPSSTFRASYASLIFSNRRDGHHPASVDLVSNLLQAAKVIWSLGQKEVPPANADRRDSYAEKLQASGFDEVRVTSISEHVFPVGIVRWDRIPR